MLIGEGIKLRQIGWGIATFLGIMCWVPNLVVVEWLVLTRQDSAIQHGITSP
jgi:hypothetical protein